jgi:RNA polymerase sigma factor (sigma-70 family)
MQRNNNQLFEQLHRQHYAMVHTVCMGFMKGEKEQANDLSQEVFINIWNALDQFRNEAAYKTWIYRITVNTCLQYLRKERKIVKLPEETISLLQVPETADKNYKTLYTAIGQLNEIERLIIMMVLEEMPYNEISKIMGITETNLRVKIHRIKSNLKKILQHEE